MLSRSIRNLGKFIARPFLTLSFAAFLTSPLFAQTELGPVTVGAGLQTSFVHTAPRGGTDTDELRLNSIRLYVNGPVRDKIKFMFNTEFDGRNTVGILDAVARIEVDRKFNIWAGRFLAPSDRANLYGPYFSHHWATFQDGVQDGYPFIFQGRTNGIAYWGDFGKFKFSGGGFDGSTATGNPNVIGAARVQVDFWDKEEGYYLNGTYYGGKNLLGIGAAVQGQSGNTATTGDFIMERKLPNGGVVSVEAEIANYDAFGGYDPKYRSSKGGYVLGAYLFPKAVGPGKFEILGKYARARFARGVTATDVNYIQKTSEVNFNYVIREFNARVMSFYKKTQFTNIRTNNWQIGVGLQVQM